MIKKILQAALFVYAFSTFSSASHAQAGYQELPNPPKKADDSRVEVLEYFWFGCPHCYAFEPTINGWAATKPDHVDFVREAPPLNPAWTPHSQAFYASQVLGIQEEFFEPFFNAIHKEKKRLASPKQISKWAGSLGLEGIDADKFLKTMKSFAVDAKIRRAMDMARQDAINSVPSVVIDRRYKTSGSVAGSNERVVDVIRELSEKKG